MIETKQLNLLTISTVLTLSSVGITTFAESKLDYVLVNDNRNIHLVAELPQSNDPPELLNTPEDSLDPETEELLEDSQVFSGEVQDIIYIGLILLGIVAIIVVGLISRKVGFALVFATVVTAIFFLLYVMLL